MKNQFRNSLFSLLGILLISACHTDIIYHSYQSLPYKGWGKSDTLFFHVSLTDTFPTALKISAEVRNRINYPYCNLYLFVRHNLPDSTIFRTDTLEFSLANKDGQWLGKGWGGIYTSECPIRRNLPAHPGQYTLKVTHGLKDEKVAGLSDIGIRIQK
ncbi:gliding motility lipoprotein GldH [Bacteroides pyogenes]|uniref:gliding motility lipoprotein GldH n=1 Tax=Bacteroides pyogenes TaxID=310300 RepID=UPI000E11A219|nr:gliding motility lipoprotein GldH [Bacteroides pyogenes]MBB3896503.1 gliding motility-associated lipoprotein GldH [Bacteroides pyogenes]SUV36226.1 putative gliding motility protein [Bacteroides pyogenes]